MLYLFIQSDLQREMFKQTCVHMSRKETVKQQGNISQWMKFL